MRVRKKNRHTGSYILKFCMFLQEECNKQRLLEAFTALTANTPLTAERIQRIRFRESFDKFIVNVRGFLFVK